MRNARRIVSPIEHIEESPLRQMRYRLIAAICHLGAIDESTQLVEGARLNTEAWLRSNGPMFASEANCWHRATL